MFRTAMRKLIFFINLTARLFTAVFDKKHNFVIIPLSFFGTRWLVKKKGGPWNRISLRRKTSDFQTFLQIFVFEDYRLQRLSKWVGIKEKYNEIILNGSKPLIVDCGANNGLSVLYFNLIFPESVIVAIEPEESNFEQLNRFAKKDKILCLKAAVSNENGYVQINDPGFGKWGFRVERAEQNFSNTIPSHTVQFLIAQARKMESVVPFLIKIDIEGHEESLFSSDTEWIRLFYVLVIELHDWLIPGKANSRHFLKSISGENRDFIYFGENIFSIQNAGQLYI